MKKVVDLYADASVFKINKGDTVMDTSTIALVLWQPDFEKLEKEDSISKAFDIISYCETPDETYICLFKYDTSWNMSDMRIKYIMDNIKNIRHAFVRLTTSGETEVDLKSFDDRGCDGEFDDIIDIDTEGTEPEIIGLDRFTIYDKLDINLENLYKVEKHLTKHGVERMKVFTILDNIHYLLFG